MSKICNQCGKIKPVSEFYADRRNKSGLRGCCKQCVKFAVVAYHQTAKGKAVNANCIRKYRQTLKGKTAHARHSSLRRLRHPEKAKAHNALNHAIQDGTMIRGVCEICGGWAEAHHENYSKPLEVRWLCPKHHRELHQSKETLL